MASEKQDRRLAGMVRKVTAWLARLRKSSRDPYLYK